MPIHIEEMSTEITAAEGELPLSHEQMEKLVDYVAQRIEQKQQEEMQRRLATEIKNSALSDW